MRYALRRLRRTPGFTLAVVLTLALGTAFSTAVVGIVRAVVGRIVPPLDLSRVWVVHVTNTMNGWDELGLPLHDYQLVAPAFAQSGIATAFSDVRGQLTVSAAGRADRVEVEAVSGSYAGLFDLRPAAGRWIVPADDEGTGRAVAVVSARLWREWFASDTRAIGRQSILILTFAIVCGMLSSVILGILTGVAASRSTAAIAIRNAGAMTGTARSRSRTLLVAVQVTAAMLLVMATGIVLENAPSDLSSRVLYDAQPLTAAEVDLTPYGYNMTMAGVFFEQLLASARRVPGVERAALASAIPGGIGAEAPDVVWLLAATRNNMSGGTRRIKASSVAVSPAFFATAGIRLERGRAFTQADGDGAPLTAILSRSAADVLFPSRDPIGAPVTYGFQGPSFTVVGIVADPVTGPSDEAPFGQPSNVVFIPLAQHPRLDATLVVRAPAAGPLGVPLRAIVRSIDDRVGLFEPARVTESRLAWAAPLNAARLLLCAGASAALTIALLGIYGMLTYFVSRRTKEFGIRMAVGATRAQIARLVFDHTVHVLLIGLLCGVLIASVGSRLLEHTLVQLMPNEIRTWAIVPMLMLATGIVAGCIPALRASRVDPNVALREL